MTGIERLRKLSEDMLSLSLWVRLTTGTEKYWDCYQGDGRTVNDELLSIANQIEQEHNISDREEHDAIAWVREHGGLDAVKRRWECLSYYADPVPRSCMEKRLARLQRQIDESHAALRRRNQRIAVLESEINRAHNENRMEFMRRAGNYMAFADGVCKRLAPQLRYVEGCTKDVMDAALDALDRRLMPESCEWPLYESGELVNLGDRYECWCGKTHVVSSVSVRKGCSVLNASDEAHTFVVSDGPLTSHGKRVKRPAVLAADGVPIRERETVWGVSNGIEFTVIGLINHGEKQVVKLRLSDDGSFTALNPDQLTHTKPEPKRTCSDCRFWQKDPTAHTLGVCWRGYAERDSEDSYEARTDTVEVCEDFEERCE